MDSFKQFKQELRDALTHLHDPDYQPPDLLYIVLGRDPREGAGPVQSDIIQVINGLEPLPDVPMGSHARQEFDLLYNRFVLKLTQEETANRLHMSVRSVRRAQRTVTHTLARLLWEHSLARRVLTDEESESGQGAPVHAGTILDARMTDWRSQVKQDLASLQMSAPGSVTDVTETIKHAVELQSVLTSKYGINLTMEQVQSGLMAAIHPAALRQILIMAIAKLARRTSSGRITIETTLEEEDIKIILTGSISAHDQPPDVDLIQEILASQGGSIGVSVDGDCASLWVKVPSVGQVTVLVVDDNLDMIHFYRRCTVGTKYHIVPAAQGQRTFEAIKSAAPDIVVLDIILPDADGWDLLARLHSHPETQPIPIIICSIVKEEELASALGAALYLPKPVHHLEFIRALDQALDRVPT